MTEPPIALTPDELKLLQEMSTYTSGVFVGINATVLSLRRAGMIEFNRAVYPRDKVERLIGLRVTDAGKAYLASLENRS